jgi:hypothetical protein
VSLWNFVMLAMAAASMRQRTSRTTVTSRSQSPHSILDRLPSFLTDDSRPRLTIRQDELNRVAHGTEATDAVNCIGSVRYSRGNEKSTKPWYHSLNSEFFNKTAKEILENEGKGPQTLHKHIKYFLIQQKAETPSEQNFAQSAQFEPCS